MKRKFFYLFEMSSDSFSNKQKYHFIEVALTASIYFYTDLNLL